MPTSHVHAVRSTTSASERNAHFRQGIKNGIANTINSSVFYLLLSVGPTTHHTVALSKVHWTLFTPRPRNTRFVDAAQLLQEDIAPTPDARTSSSNRPVHRYRTPTITTSLEQIDIHHPSPPPLQHLPLLSAQKKFAPATRDANFRWLNNMLPYAPISTKKR